MATAVPTTTTAYPHLSPPRTNWHGHWVWPTAATPQRNAYALFRRTFACAAAGTLDVAITADSFYVLYVDGVFVCRGPARAHLSSYSFDEIHLMLTPGRHCVAVLAHHIGEVNATVMTGRAGLLADVTLKSKAGAIDLSTGPDWKCQAATAWRQDLPCTMSHFGFWEDCDLRQLPMGWATPDFDDHAWGVPVTVGTPPCAPWPNLCPRDIPLPRYADIAAVACAAGAWRQTAPPDPILAKTVAARLRTPAPGRCALPHAVHLPDAADTGHYLVVDFGRTVSGYVVLDVADAPPGTCLELSYDDLLTDQGTVNPERSYAHLSDRFVLPGGRCRLRTSQPRGFRYAMLDLSGAGALLLERVTALEETYPFEIQAAFECDDPTLNRFYHKAAETVRICTTDAFTDCATRERVQWMEDLYMHSQVAAYAFGDTRMLRHALFQAAQCALPDGRINGFMPSERTNCAFAASSILWLHLLVDYWRFSGAEDVRELLPTARRLLDFMATRRDGDGLIASWPAGQFWDWAPIEGEGCLLLTNAAYAWALERLAAFSVFTDALGSELAAEAATLRRGCHARFWDAGRGLYRDAQPANDLTPIYSQHANTMAVLAGVCPAAEQPALLRRITDPARLGPVPVGEHSLGKGPRPDPDQIVPMGTLWFAHFLCQALFTTGLDREALEQMRALWGAHENLPTFPETRIQHGNTFLCHGWAAGPAYLLPAFVLGVRPVAAGWERANVTPHPGGLQNARGTLATPHGPLTVAWTLANGHCVVSSTPLQGVELVERA